MTTFTFSLFLIYSALFAFSNYDVQASSVPQSASEGDVIRELLSRDVKYGKPDAEGIVEVQLGLYIEAVTEVDVEKGTVELVGFLSMQWNDPRLRFEHSDPFHHAKSVRLPRGEIWTPDIELYTQVTPGMQIMNTARDQVLVEYNGTVKWYPMVSLRTLCADLAHNKSEVSCDLKFGSWTYHASLLNVVANQPMGVLSQYRSTGQWTVSKATGERMSVKYDCCPDNYIFIAYHLTFIKRQI